MLNIATAVPECNAVAAAGEWSPAPRFSETPDFGAWGPGIPAGPPGGFGRDGARCLRGGPGTRRGGAARGPGAPRLAHVLAGGVGAPALPGARARYRLQPLCRPEGPPGDGGASLVYGYGRPRPSWDGEEHSTPVRVQQPGGRRESSITFANIYM